MRFKFIFKVIAVTIIVIFIFLFGGISALILQSELDEYYGYECGVWGARVFLPNSVPADAINLHEIQEIFYKKYGRFSPCYFRLYQETFDDCIAINIDFSLYVSRNECPEQDLTYEKIEKEIEEEINLRCEKYQTNAKRQ